MLSEQSGLIASGDEAILIDTAYTIALTDQMLAQIAADRPGLHITRCVLTHGNGDHSYGVAALPEAVELITSRACADSLNHEVPPAVLAAAMAAGPEPLRSYLLEHFGQFDFAGAELPSPDTTFKLTIELEIGSRRIELIETGPAHTAGDVVIHVPDAGVLYAGDIVFSQDTPIAWASVRGILEACQTLAGTEARLIVPGHGPVVPIGYLTQVRTYFEHLLQHADRCGSAGMPYYEAAASMPLGSFAQLGLPGAPDDLHGSRLPRPRNPRRRRRDRRAHPLTHRRSRVNAGRLLTARASGVSTIVPQSATGWPRRHAGETAGAVRGSHRSSP